jgi:DNA-binding NarL/FixJ family response regulator
MSFEKDDIIRVLVIEDNATLVLAGLRNFFRPGRDQIHVKETAGSVEEAFQKVSIDSFDVILLDLIIPGTTPKENMNALNRRFPRKPVVIYTSLDSNLWRKTMWNLGASGYVHKNEGRDKLKHTIMDAFSGKVIYPTDVSSGNETAFGIEFQTPGLSIIEKELLSMLIRGMKYKQISEVLKIKNDQIETIMKQLRKKFDTKSTPQLIFRLTEHGLI